jgi:hypothetical protein
MYSVAGYSLSSRSVPERLREEEDDLLSGVPAACGSAAGKARVSGIHADRARHSIGMAAAAGFGRGVVLAAVGRDGVLHSDERPRADSRGCAGADSRGAPKSRTKATRCTSDQSPIEFGANLDDSKCRCCRALTGVPALADQTAGVGHGRYRPRLCENALPPTTTTPYAKVRATLIHRQTRNPRTSAPFR